MPANGGDKGLKGEDHSCLIKIKKKSDKADSGAVGRSHTAPRRRLG